MSESFEGYSEFISQAAFNEAVVVQCLIQKRRKELCGSVCGEWVSVGDAMDPELAWLYARLNELLGREAA